MGARTKLPPREERRLIDAGTKLLLKKTARESERQDREFLELRRGRAPRHYEEHGVKYASFLTKQMQRDVAHLKKHELELVQEKMRSVTARPTELGEGKWNEVRGFRGVKVDRVENVLLFKIDEAKRTVIFARYGDHSVYDETPKMEGGMVSFEAWTAHQ